MKHINPLLATMLLILWCILVTSPAYAHANLVRTDPPANASLEVAPVEIRLVFTEPLDAVYSRVTLLDASGETVVTAPASLDPADPYQLVLPADDLNDGLYTVSWRVVSAADGHATQGSFAFGVGTTVNPEMLVSQVNETVPAVSAVIRGLNLLSLVLFVGGLGFYTLVWQPATGLSQTSVILKTIVLWWGCVGVMSVLILGLQASIAADVSLLEVWASIDWVAFVSGSTFGHVWLLRVVLWTISGLLLVIAARRALPYWPVLVVSAALLWVHSLISHAAAVEDRGAAVAANGLHLLGTSLWFGGLVMLFGVLLSRKHIAEKIPVHTLAVYFSNYARIAIAAVILSGLYAAWLHVGQIDLLWTTVYGQALLIKLILFAPVLLIAAVNAFVTVRHLRHPETISIWSRRLRGLVALEILFTVGILALAAVMTAGMPARGVAALRAAIPTMPQPSPYSGMNFVNDQMLHLDIVPGYVGENTFSVTPFDSDGNPITDASLIRLRFNHLERDLGQSELRPELSDSGIYSVKGANLSTPGRWRVRMTIQRPGQFDMVSDFELEVGAAPTPVFPEPDMALPFEQRWQMAGAIGTALIIVGVFWGQLQRPRPRRIQLVALSLLVVGGVLIASALGQLI